MNMSFFLELPYGRPSLIPFNLRTARASLVLCEIRFLPFLSVGANVGYATSKLAAGVSELGTGVTSASGAGIHYSGFRLDLAYLLGNVIGNTLGLTVGCRF